jgi:tetrahydromethanopterin S-methyltransferase subunit G
LTDKGIRVLSALDEREESSTETIDQEELKQLRARLDAIESTEFGADDDVSAGKVVSQLEQVQTRIDEMESMVEGNIQRFNERLDAIEEQLDNEWGALDADTAEDIGRVLNLSPVLFMLWSEVFSVDVRELVLQDTITDELKVETQEDVLTAIERGLDGTGEVGGGSEISDVSRGSIPQQEESGGQSAGSGGGGQAELDETGDETTSANISPPDGT